MIKKVILVLVEGYNDKSEIEKLLKSDNFNIDKDKYLIIIKNLDFDITADYKSTKKTIVQILSNKFNRLYKEDPDLRNIRHSDICKIIQIVDLDGAFIPDQNIIYDSTADKLIYEDDCIKTRHTQKIRERNSTKRNNLILLSQRDNLEGKPYKVYFASCNMDHLLFNKRNCPREEKANNKVLFLTDDSYTNKVIHEAFENNSIVISTNYKDSWKEITKENNSLLRKTNLNLFFDEFK